MSLTTNGIEIVTYPKRTQRAVHEAVQQWQHFLALPQDIKDEFIAHDAYQDVGYERKSKGRYEGSDRKENFDLTRAGIEALRHHPNHQTIESLLATTAQLLSTLTTTTQEFCQSVESIHNITNFHQTARHSEVDRFIRFLHYPPTPEGTVIGEAHTDHSGYTLHLYESTDGCRGLSPTDNTWFSMPVATDEMVVFGGMQLQLVSHNRVKALCHEITANANTARTGRIAIVCFNSLADIPIYDRAAHGRLQDKTPGFNYHTTPSEFAKLFRDTTQ